MFLKAADYIVLAAEKNAFLFILFLKSWWMASGQTLKLWNVRGADFYLFLIFLKTTEESVSLSAKFLKFK